MDTIRGLITGVEGITTVLINPPETRKIEIALLPLVVVWDEVEEVRRVNRLEESIFPLHLQLWTHGKTFWRDAENFRAKIKRVLYTSPAMKKFSASYLETRSDKFFNDSLSGGIDTWGNVTYRTNAVNPNTQTF
jgi:hypothetical protein